MGRQLFRLICRFVREKTYCQCRFAIVINYAGSMDVRKGTSFGDSNASGVNHRRRSSRDSPQQFPLGKCESDRDSTAQTNGFRMATRRRNRSGAILLSSLTGTRQRVPGFIGPSSGSVAFYFPESVLALFGTTRLRTCYRGSRDVRGDSRPRARFLSIMHSKFIFKFLLPAQKRRPRSRKLSATFIFINFPGDIA